MKKLIPLLLLLLFTCFQAVPAITPVKIVSGQLFVGGSSFGTPDYQTYLAFDLTARRRMPRIGYNFVAEQFFSVFQNHPANPTGNYEFLVQMPYDPAGLYANGEFIRPVWYSDSRWLFRSFVQTPTPTKNSPNVLIIRAPFTMNGLLKTYGAREINIKSSGEGMVELKFEKIEGRYFLIEARYIFGEEAKKEDSKPNGQTT